MIFLSVIRLGRHTSWSVARREPVYRKSRHSDFDNSVSFTIPTIVSDIIPGTRDRAIECRDVAFRCISRNPRQQWDTLVQCKAQIMDFVWSPVAGSGIKLSAVKFMQRMILLMTRGVSDPRVRAPLLSGSPSTHKAGTVAPEQERSQYFICSCGPPFYFRSESRSRGLEAYRRCAYHALH